MGPGFARAWRAELAEKQRCTSDLADRTIIVDGVSKTYAMTGFRVGWLLGPREVARSCEKLQSQITTSVSVLSQLASVAALSGDQTSVQRMRAQYVARRDRMVAGLRALPGVTCDVPRGAFYVFADVQAWLGRRAAGARAAERSRRGRVADRCGARGDACPAPRLGGRVTCACRAAALSDIETALAQIATRRSPELRAGFRTKGRRPVGSRSRCRSRARERQDHGAAT